MTVLTDADQYVRGAATLLASWEEYARGATGAAVQRSPGLPTALFSNEPERAVRHKGTGPAPGWVGARPFGLGCLASLGGRAERERQAPRALRDLARAAG